MGHEHMLQMLPILLAAWHGLNNWQTLLISVGAALVGAECGATHSSMHSVQACRCRCQQSDKQGLRLLQVMAATWCRSSEDSAQLSC